MFSQIHRKSSFADRPQGKIRRDDRRAAIARKSAFLVDGLTIRAGE